jgi:transposase
MAEGPLETERIALSNRERDRLKVLHEIQQKHLTQVAGAQRLKVSDRQVRRMLLRLRERGDRSLVHGLRGRPSNRKLATRFEQKILAHLRQRYADFGPTLAAEHLAQEGFSVSRETLRKWMTKAALWRPRSQRVKTIHVWRERRACFGELVMQDSSPFRWLEERGPACHLIALMDDATSRIWDGLPSTTLRKRTCARLADGYGATDVPWPSTPIKTASFERPARSHFPNNCGEIRCEGSSGER